MHLITRLAYDKNSDLILPKFYQKINRPYSCPNCNRRVIRSKNGISGKLFFCHFERLECYYYEQYGGGESMIHRSGQVFMAWVLSNYKNITFDREPILKSCKCKNFVSYDYEEGDKVYQNYKIANGEVDIIILDKDEKIKLLVEIYHTHKTENRPEPWVEISTEHIKNIQDKIENTPFEQPINIKCRRKILCDKDCLGLDEKQLDAIKKINTQSNVLITGPGGVGKTYLIQIIREFFGKEQITLTATTALASTLIGGVTYQSALGIGQDTDIEVIRNKIEENSQLKDIWLNLHTLLIDEVSMLGGKMLDTIEQLARKIRNINKIFGGIQVILIGDFYQCPPINEKYAFEAECFFKLISPQNCITLTKSHRQDNIKFFNVSNNIRTGNITQETMDYFYQFVIKDGHRKTHPITKLYSTNRDIDKENDCEFDKLVSDDREVNEYNSETRYMPFWHIIQKYRQKDYMKTSTRFDEDNENSVSYKDLKGVGRFPITISTKLKKYLDTVGKSVPKNKLKLCVGALVMLRVNYDKTKNLVNGSTGIVVGFDEEKNPIVKFFTENKDGEKVVEPIKKWAFHFDIMDDYINYHFRTIQLPLNLAWATTIHKSQGQSLDNIEIDIKNIFGKGQLYVSLSRVRGPNGLKISNISRENFDIILLNHSKYFDDAVYRNQEVLDFYDYIKKNN